jgi:hypothetical protein
LGGISEQEGHSLSASPGPQHPPPDRDERRINQERPQDSGVGWRDHGSAFSLGIVVAETAVFRSAPVESTASIMTAARRSQPAQRLSGLSAEQRDGRAARQGSDDHRLRPVAQGPRRHQQHLLHGLPRPGHAQGQGRGACGRVERPHLPEGRLGRRSKGFTRNRR